MATKRLQAYQDVLNRVPKNVDLNENIKQTLTWAEKKMHEEINLKAMMERHPGLKELNDKFEMMRVLCQEEEKEKIK